jgi:hypothetical protein
MGASTARKTGLAVVPLDEGVDYEQDRPRRLEVEEPLAVHDWRAAT